MVEELLRSEPVEANTHGEQAGLINLTEDLSDTLSDFEEDFFLDLYYKMQLIRRFEQRSYQVYLQQKIGGFCHLYTGQEAVAVGAYASIESGRDYSITAYRDHGYALAAGMSASSVMAELYGKKTGYSSGKGGSMHLFDSEKNFMGGHAIVGAHIPLATGLGFSIKYRGENSVVICFLGDGAMNQGAVHEGMNLAGLYGLPVIFICENNGYGMGTQVKRASAEERLYMRSDAYAIPGYRVDGLDVLTTYSAFSQVVKKTRQTGNPVFMELMTYRYRGHSMSDPAKYRSDEELEEYKKKDPIENFKKQLLEAEIVQEKKIEELDHQVETEVDEALDFAEKSEEPEVEALYEDLYVSYPRSVKNKQ